MSSPLDPRYDYIGMEFTSTRWADVCRSCIVPPDIVFRREELWLDEQDAPIPTPKGHEGEESIVLLWRMDEDEGLCEPLRRPRLYALFAAFAELYTRHAGRRGCVRLFAVRSKDKPRHLISHVPAINFHLWETAFLFMDAPFMFMEYDVENFGRDLPEPEPPLPAESCMAARKEWTELLLARADRLLTAIRDATDYEVHSLRLEECISYLGQMSADYLEVQERMERLRFMPWYAEVLRRMPGLNPMGLCLVRLESLGRYALYDYRPEEGRRFRFEEGKKPWEGDGRLMPAQDGEDVLPYDAASHLHLLPIPVSHHGFRIPDVPSCVWFREDWI